MGLKGEQCWAALTAHPSPVVWHLPRGQAGPHAQPENRARDILPGASLNVTEARLSTLLLLSSTALNTGIAQG